MRKRLYVLLLSCVAFIGAYAQLADQGYYRIQNVNTKRWMSLCDNTSTGIDLVATVVDCGALVTNRNWEEISTDLGSIFYIEKLGDSNLRPNTIEINVSGQGTSIKEMINYTLLLTKMDDGYRAWQQEKSQPVTLGDQNAVAFDKSSVVTIGENFIWNINRIDAENNYVGVKPTVAIGGKHYAAVFAGFPYTLSEGMKAYYIKQVDEERGIAVYQELKGTIPAKTPVLLECASDKAKQNLITPVHETVEAPADNVATGIYFCLGDEWTGHYNSTQFDATKMRVLASNAAGKLVASTATDHLTEVMVREMAANNQHKTVLAIPANSWYLKVSANAPTELTLMSAEEYATGITTIGSTPTKITYDVYTLEGVQVLKNAASISSLPKGMYIVNGKKVIVK